jgi:hypothetical protein
MKKKLIVMVVAYAYGMPARDRKADPSSRMALAQLWREGRS